MAVETLTTLGTVAVGEESVLMKRAGEPTEGARLVCVAHGAGQTASAGLVDILDNRMTMWALAESGLVVLAITGEANGFGNPAGKAKWDAAIEWAENTLGVRDDGCLGYGGSMGSATLFDHWHESPEKWKAIATIIGLVDMRDLVTNDRITEAGSVVVRNAYGAANDAALEAYYPDHSPWEFRTEIADAIDDGSLAVATWGSSNDTACLPSIAEDFAEDLGIDHTIYGAFGHAGPGTVLPDIAAWLHAQA